MSSWSIRRSKKPGDAAQAFHVFDRDGDDFSGLENLEFAVKLGDSTLFAGRSNRREVSRRLGTPRVNWRRRNNVSAGTSTRVLTTFGHGPR